MSMPADPRLQLEVTDVQAEARDVILLELRARGGGELPAFLPGAHVEVDLPNGLVRHYSLTNDWRERDRYVIGIGRSARSRGGSLFAHQALRRGATLPTSSPRNGFPLEPSARRFLFLAGGIGITPIVAMIRWCQAMDRPWRLAYAVRSAQRAAFHETLKAMGGPIHLHADDQASGVFDPGPWLVDEPEGEHVYCCGPGPMISAVRAAASHRRPETIHFEYFSAPVDSAATPPAGSFTVELRRSGRSIVVTADKSILEALEQNGVRVPNSCREGLCRTCETTVCEGAVEHRDYVLSQDEREAGSTMMVCVSRAKGERLVLDL
jgi:vanillate O-demethylase ferredoxin subunit